MFVNLEQRGRIKTQKKAKVVAAFWGTELIFISCRGNYSAQGWFEERDEFHASYCPLAIHSFFQIVLKQFIQLFISSVVVQFIQFFKSSWCKTASDARNSRNSAPQAATTFAISSVFSFLLWHAASTFCRILESRSTKNSCQHFIYSYETRKNL